VTVTQAGTLPTKEEMWEMLKKQNQEIQALKLRLSQSEMRQGRSEKKVNNAIAKVEASSTNHSGMKWSDRLSISGSVAIDAIGANNYADANSSSIAVNAAELSVDAIINDWVTSNITLLYEENANTAINVDSATITIANAKETPLFLKAGSQTVPFGGFATNMLSDPLTQSLGEAAEVAVVVGATGENLSASVYAFNGSSETGADDTIDHFGANIAYTGNAGGMDVEVGAGWINALEDSDTIQGAIAGTNNNINSMVDHIPGAEIHAKISSNGFTIIGEYLTALEDFDASELTWNTTGTARPSAWATEVGYSFNMAGKEATVAAGYQGSKEALGLGMAKRTVLGSLAVGIFKNTTLAFEWKHDTDYETSENSTVDGAAAATTGTGKDQDTATVQLSVSF
jgi:hypothetical protein